jgi:hypothetical protein
MLHMFHYMTFAIVPARREEGDGPRTRPNQRGTTCSAKSQFVSPCSPSPLASLASPAWPRRTNSGAADTRAAGVETTGPIARIVEAAAIMAAVVTMVDVSRIAAGATMGVAGATMGVAGTAASDHDLAVSHGDRRANDSDHRGLTVKKPDSMPACSTTIPTPSQCSSRSRDQQLAMPGIHGCSLNT